MSSTMIQRMFGGSAACTGSDVSAPRATARAAVQKRCVVMARFSICVRIPTIMITRRQAVKSVAAASVGSAMGAAFSFAKTNRANLLFLCSDQHQTAASGCYGSNEAQTPHIDEIAADGVRFDRAYCNAPVCVPSRGSIITGLHPCRHGAKNLRDPLPNEARTVAHYFKDHGYVTGAIGKMHFVDETRRHGFDHRLYRADHDKRLTQAEQQAFRDDQYAAYPADGGYATGLSGSASTLPERYFQDTFYAEESVAFLRENKDRPFCLWSSFYMPHTPLVPAKQYWDMYDGVTLSLPERSDRELQDGFEGHLIRSRQRGWYDQKDDDLRDAIRGYYGNISQTDANVGRVFDTLRELGLDKNTVVVYTSDHGEMAGAHRTWTKHNMYEQSVSVPLIVRMPDRMEAGTARTQLIEHTDLLPTLTELCGLGSPSSGIDGRSFAPLVQGGAYTPREHAYSEYYFCHRSFTVDDRYVGKPPILMVRTGKWKLNYLSWARSELYDLEADPGEFNNVIDDTGNSGIVRELTAVAERLYAG